MPRTSATSSARDSLAPPVKSIIRLRETMSTSVLCVFGGLARLAATRVAGDFLLVRSLHGKSVVAEVFCDHRASASCGPVADPDRGNQHGVRTDERVLSDIRL